MFCYSGDTAYKMEHTRRFSYANLQYFLNIFVGVLALGMGFYGLKELVEIAKEIKKESGLSA